MEKKTEVREPAASIIEQGKKQEEKVRLTPLAMSFA
jgi:hypothetical protein